MAFSAAEATTQFRLQPDRNVKNTRTLNLSLEDPSNGPTETKLKQEALRQYMHATFEVYEKVYETLTCDEAYTVRPIHKLRHPLIFYLGHTATFYINKLALAGLTTRINHKFEETFAIGVDEMSWDDLNEAHYDWPSVAEVWSYRRAVRQRLDDLFAKFTLKLPLNFGNCGDDDTNTFFWAIAMGIEHERIHLETASVHVRELPLKYVRHLPFWDPCTEDVEAPTRNPLVEFAGGKVNVGRQIESPIYGWDCDYSNKLVISVEPFKASEHIVSNAEFFEFVKDGGYAQRELWDEEGWNWVSWKKPEHPWFWVKGEEEGDFKLRLQCTEIPLPWSWPAEVNNLEATAYCAWLGKKQGKKLRLPTEAEWLHMRDTCLGGKKDQHEWSVAPGNVNLEHFCSSCPVTKFKQDKLYDIVGNVWQHCETPVYPYQGYKVHPLYDDFSMPTFDGRHRCMKGGTWVSTGNEASRDARFAFRRHFFQYIGIRYVEGVEVDEMAHMKDVLGLDPPVDLAAQRSYSALPPTLEIAPKEVYGKVLAQVAIAHFQKHAKRPAGAQRAMDLMCGAGRASYELSLTFPSVTGVDFSARMLQPAYAMRERGMASYSTLVSAEEGRKAATALAKDFEWGNRREDVLFYQSDPANLHAHLANYDLILAFDVMDRATSYDPALVPAHLVTRLAAGGVLVVAEPASKEHRSALSTQQYMAALEATGVVEMVEPVTQQQLYLAETESQGKVVVFDVFAARKKAE